MNKIKKYKYHLLSLSVLAGIMMLSSCSENDYMKFDQNYSGLYLTEDSVHYSFGTMPLETRTYTVRIPVKIMGATSNVARTFSIAVLEPKEYEKPEEGLQYTIDSGELLIMPDSINGFIPVKLLRDGLAGDDDNGFTRYELRLKLTRNENFQPTLSEAEQNVVLTFDNAISKPSWYNEGVWISHCGEWNSLKLIKIMEFFHTVLKDSAPTIYDKMVADIGENWEKVQYGWPSDYNYAVRKYILTPCYEYFLEHPEHGISDFPDPNA